LENKIRAFPQAIGSVPQKLKLHLGALGSGGNSVAPPMGAPMSEEYEIVDATTLDEIQKQHLPDHPKTLIKIDVEYFEYEVLEGAKNWLGSPNSPIILLEAGPKNLHSDQNHVLVIKKLQSFSYDVYPVLLPLNGSSPLGKACSFLNYKSPTVNYLALPPHAFSLRKMLQSPIDIRIFSWRNHLESLLSFLKNSMNALELA
jgi:hypothetical protein